MITTGKNIYSILSADTGVTALVGANIYPLVIPEGNSTNIESLLPCIIYERSFNNGYTRDGLCTSESQANITILSKQYSNAIDISNAVFQALNMYSDSKIKSIRLISGSEIFSINAFIQNLTFEIDSLV